MYKGRLCSLERVLLAGDEHLKNPSADSKSLTVTLVKSSHKKWKELFQTAGPAS